MEQKLIDKIKISSDALIGQKKYSEAIVLLKSLLEKLPHNPAAYLFLGDAYQHIDKNEAISYYKKGLKIDGKNPYLNTALGFYYYNHKDFINAERYLSNIWLEDPTNIRLLTALGKIYKSWKQYEKAKKYYIICELLEPSNSFAIYGLADTYRGIGNHEMALKYWLKFHLLEPLNKVALTRIGDCYFNLGDKQNSLLFYTKALAIGYDFFACIGTAKVHNILGNAAKGLEIFEKIGKTEENNSRYYYEFINFCLNAGLKEKAFDLHSKANALFPGNNFIESLNTKILALMN